MKKNGTLNKDKLKELFEDGNLTKEEMKRLAAEYGIELDSEDLENIQDNKRQKRGDWDDSNQKVTKKKSKKEI